MQGDLDSKRKIDLAVSIIGCGDYLTLLSHRYAKLPSSDQKQHAFESLFPSSLQSLVLERDPLNKASHLNAPSPSLLTSHSSQSLPSLLHIFGGKDSLVPQQCSSHYLEKLGAVYRSGNCPERIDTWVDTDTGHKCSKAMMVKAAEWVEKWWCH
ncbi:hypothetical protein BKA69DRAFT_1105759 [Paraphysoderma sedebokerense]|nr:hypothetical protein BKA69DRAFT_1105759 [Paraphysoderma sedebokerense]